LKPTVFDLWETHQTGSYNLGSFVRTDEGLPDDVYDVEEKCFSSTEKSPGSAILDEILQIEVDFGA
jgi:hypothetical protein